MWGLEDASSRRRITRASLGFAPKEYHELLVNSRFLHLLRLLSDEDLGRLMQIPYPADVAERTAVAAPTKDADIIREAIARQLKKKADELTDKDYSKITSLDLRGSDITELEPIKGLSSLQTLYLGGTDVSDLRPLRGLANLRSLYLSGTQVSKLEPIEALKALRTLYLRGTPVTDLKPIRGLSGLRKLHLARTKVSDEQVAKLQEALPKLSIVR